MKIGEQVKEGTMVVMGDQAWGVTYNDGKSCSYGWVNPAQAQMGTEFVKKPTDVTYPGSSYERELNKPGVKVVKVRRTTTIEVVG